MLYILFILYVAVFLQTRRIKTQEQMAEDVSLDVSVNGFRKDLRNASNGVQLVKILKSAIKVCDFKINLNFL